jgi:hypothetical protein
MPSDKNHDNLFWASQSTSSSINTSSLQTLKSILDQYDFNNLTSDQQTTLYSQLSSSGLFQSSNLFNQGA